MKNKNTIYFLFLFVIIVLGIYFVAFDEKENIPIEIPEKITYYKASNDLIVVELPFPGAVTGKEFYVLGKARGNWFFEASFPIDVLDKDGKILFQTYATAQG